MADGQTKPTDGEAAPRGPGRRRQDYRRQWLDSWLPLVLAGILIIATLSGVVSVVVLHQQGQIRHTQERLNASIRGSCARVQTLRDDVNQLSDAIFTVLYPLRRQSPIFEGIASRMVYLPPTNCKRAEEDPSGYRPPAGVPFRLVAECFKPPRSIHPSVPCRRKRRG